MENERRAIRLPDGKRYEIVGENGKFWLCKTTQFRKGRSDYEIVELPAKKVKAETEEAEDHADQ